MQKRIISLFLAVVMLFSCLSLNVFATADTDVTEAATVLTNTLDAHTDEEIEKLIAAAAASSVSGSYKIEFGSLTSVSSNNSAGLFSYNEQTGKIEGLGVKTAGTAHYIQVNTLYGARNRGTTITNYQDYEAEGENFVVQLDIKLTQDFIDKGNTQELVNLGHYGANTGYYTKSYRNYFRPALVSDNYLAIKNGNQLYVRNDGSDVKVADLTLDADKNYTVAMVVDASTQNGSYDVYVNGECVAEDCKFLSDGDLSEVDLSSVRNDSKLKMTVPTPYFLDSAWESDNKTLKADQTAYFFVDESELPENILETIVTEMETAGITVSGAPTEAVALGSRTGMAGYALGLVRLFNTDSDWTVEGKENAKLWEADNFCIYNVSDSSQYVNYIEHDLVTENAHEHDFSSATVFVKTESCTLCDGYAGEYRAIDANGDKVCDICVGDALAGGLLSPSEIGNYADLVILADALDEGTNADFNGQNKGGMIGFSTDENGNRYVKYSAPTEYDNNNNYIQINSKANNATNAVKNFGAYAGKAYTISFDLAHYGKEDFGKLMQIYCYLGEPTIDSDGNVSSTIGNVSVVPLKLDKNGTLEYVDVNETGSEIYRTLENVEIKPDGTFYNVLFRHEPKDNVYDLFIDGELVVKGAKLLDDANKEALAWEANVAEDGTMGSYTPNAGDLKDGKFVVTDEDWVLSLIRFPQIKAFNTVALDKVTVSDDGTTVTYNGKTYTVNNTEAGADNVKLNDTNVLIPKGDVLAFDNFKVYQSEHNVECPHSYTLSHEHNLDTKENCVTYSCDTCGKTVEFDFEMSIRNNGESDCSKYNGTGIPSIYETNEIYGEDLIYATDFTDEIHYGAVMDDSNKKIIDGSSNASGNIGIRTYSDDAGNKYLGCGPTTAPESDITTRSYVDIRLLGTTGGEQRFEEIDRVKELQEHGGKSYVLSFDFKFDANQVLAESQRPVFQIMSYVKHSGNDISNSSVTFSPLYICKNGVFKYCPENDTDSLTNLPEDANAILTDGNYHNIAVHHNPTLNTYDIYVDTKLVVAGIQALSDTNFAASRFTIDIAEDDTWTVTDTDKSADAKFTPTQLRIMQMRYKAGYTEVAAVDNLRLYRSESYDECAHSYTDSNVCNDCGKLGSFKLADKNYCDICEGHALSLHLAVTDTQVSLGGDVAMKILMKLSKSKLTEEEMNNVKIVLSADEGENERLAEYPLADAAPEEDGKYAFTLSLRATQMTKAIKTAVEADSVKGPEFSTTVTDYLSTLLQKPDLAEEEETLAVALLNYGAYAQKYFAEEKVDDTLDDDLASKILNQTQLDTYNAKMGEITEESLKAYQAIVTGNTSNIEVQGVTLVLTGRARMNLYFFASENAVVTIDGKAVEKTQVADGRYFISVSPLSPAGFDDAYSVEITDGTYTVSTDISMLCAAEAVLFGESDTEYGENFENLAKALCLYYDAAKAYQN